MALGPTDALTAPVSRLLWRGRHNPESALSEVVLDHEVDLDRDQALMPVSSRVLWRRAACSESLHPTEASDGEGLSPDAQLVDELRRVRYFSAVIQATNTTKAETIARSLWSLCR